MEQENLNKEGPEAVIATRWILAIGLGGLALFLILSYLWFDLTGNSKPTTTTPATASVATVSSVTQTTLLTSATKPVFPVLKRTATSLPTTFATPVPTVIPEPSATLPFMTAFASTTTAAATFTFSANSSPPDPTMVTPAVIATAVDTPLVTATTPQATLAQTVAQRFDQLQTVHFTLEVKAGKVEILTGTQLKRAEGDLARPNSFQAKIYASVLIGEATINTIGINGEQYITNPLTNSWSKLSQSQTFNLSLLFDKQNGISGLVRQLQQVENLGEATLGGVACVHFVGTLPGSAVSPVTHGIFGRNPVTLDVWAGRDDNLIRQLYLKETTSNGAFWVITFSRFDQTVNIQKPI